ncbi:hypothetical protein B0H19DRAFT_1236008 [Mycena capillaripes]|nr:hypothetical protein B0H19DRAFT_1236008 [Mycena capillaripes]
MTKDEFFPTYDQFLKVFQNRESGRLRRYRYVGDSLQSDTRSRIPCLSDDRRTPQEIGRKKHPRTTPSEATMHSVPSEDLQQELQHLRHRNRELEARTTFIMGGISAHLMNMDRSNLYESGTGHGLSIAEALGTTRQLEREIAAANTLLTTYIA